MLKLFKWIYNLGYKKAEDRYYFALMEAVQKEERNLALFESPRSIEAVRRRELCSALRNVVHEVFHPDEYRDGHPVDKFKP